MWISSKRYHELWQEVHNLQKDKDTLIRMVSGIVVHQGGEITIPLPSNDSRTLSWTNGRNGTVIIKSEVYDTKDMKFKTSGNERPFSLSLGRPA